MHFSGFKHILCLVEWMFWRANILHQMLFAAEKIKCTCWANECRSEAKLVLLDISIVKFIDGIYSLHLLR